ncbi:MAG: ATP-binding protein [Anaerolineales bacterium]
MAPLPNPNILMQTEGRSRKKAQWLAFQAHYDDAILRRFVTACTQQLGASSIAVILFNDDAYEPLDIVALLGAEHQDDCWHTLRQQIETVAPTERPAKLGEIATYASQNLGYLRLPLEVDHHFWGVCILAHPIGAGWGLAEETLAQSLTDTLALFIQKLAYEQRLQRSQALQQATHRIAQLLDDDISLANALEYILVNLRELFALSSASVMLNIGDGKLDMVASYAMDRVKHWRQQIGFGEGIVGHVATTCQTVLLTDYAQFDSALAPVAAHNAIQAALAVPLLSRDTLVGVLGLIQLEDDSLPVLTPNDALLLERLAPLVAMVIENTQLRDRVRQERAQLQAVLDYVPVPILLFDHRSKLVLANPIAHNVGQRVGISLYSFIGRSLQAIVDSLPPDSEIPSNFEDDAVGELNLGIGGRFLATMAQVPGLLGGQPGNVVVLQEVTEERRLNEARSSLLSVLSHDLGNKLSLSLGYAALLLDEVQTPEDQQHFIERIYSSLEEARTLIRNVVEIEYAEAQGVHIAKPYDLRLLADEICRGLQPAAQDKEQTLTCEWSLPFEAPLVGNDALMKQALENLITNALKYTPPSGAVQVLLDADDVYARIRIADTGIGIPQEELARIWERFYRVERAETKNIEGTGLGLTLVQSVIKSHGGSITAESELGQGTTFTIYLPLATDDRPPSADT